MSNYQEQIAHWRAQRQRQETEARLDEVRREYSEVQAARDEAYREGNAGDFDHYDRRCEELETEYLHSLPPDQQAAVSPQVRAFAAKHRAFFDRHGVAAIQACGLAHNYVTAPRDPNNVHNKAAGMGIRFNTPQYFEAVENLLEMYWSAMIRCGQSGDRGP